LAALRRRWLGRILDRYRQSRTTVIFIRLARGAIVRPDNLVHKKSAVIREFASRPNVSLVGEHAFDALEHPELYRDAVHLNREGTARFTTMLVGEVTKILGAPRQSARGEVPAK
jgi:lysophospholipase L1-like esterase